MAVIHTKKMPLILAIAGTEQEIDAEVRYIDIPGNPARFDEPDAEPSIEILSVDVLIQASIGGFEKINKILSAKTWRSIENEILSGSGPADAAAEAKDSRRAHAADMKAGL